MLSIKDTLVQLNVEEAKILQVPANSPTSAETLHAHKQIETANVGEVTVNTVRGSSRLSAGTVLIDYQRYVKVILKTK